MKPAGQFQNILKAMSDPAFYPHAVSRIEFRETHISAVFLTGQWVYKLKKAKNLGFLDFRELSDRRHFCRREVELNQRLSTGVYHGVVAIHEDGRGNLSFGPEGDIVEYAVKMAQLPEASNLAALLGQGDLDDGRLAALGGTLADFYARAERGPGIDAFGDPDIIRFNTEENFEQIQPFVAGRLDADAWDFIREVSRSFRADREDLFRHRMRTGRIRDGHGDLRADHVYFHDGVQIIDCIEFNERFRYGDAALDLAFLMMDLDRLGHGRTGRRLLAAYARTARDPEIYALLDFYAAYRALVRLKVACFSLKDDREPLPADAGRCFSLAYRYALSFGRPALWVFSGLPASGKSTLAERTAQALFMPLFQSDSVRKRDPGFPDEGVTAFNAGAYRPVLRGRVYAKLLNLAQEELRKGRSVALDATFGESRWRQAAVELAADHNVGIVFVRCTCSTETIRSRLARREEERGTSDARLFHLDDMIRNFEPFGAETEGVSIATDTDRDVEESFYDTLAAGHALKSAQAEALANGSGPSGPGARKAGPA